MNFERNNIIHVVDIILKDGTFLKEAVIFRTGRVFESGINSIELIEEKFNNIDQGFDNMITFQTSMINGRFHPSNVESYKIHVKLC